MTPPFWMNSTTEFMVEGASSLDARIQYTIGGYPSRNQSTASLIEERKLWDMLAACLMLTSVGSVVREDPSAPIVVRGLDVTVSGKSFRIHGINVPSMEWMSSGENVVRTIHTAIDDWHANFIRLPLNQDRWFGKASDSTGDGTSYRQLVDEAVDAASKRGAYILLDLHWSDMGEWGDSIDQHALPDAHSLEFWKAVSARYANRPAVLFDLYNEPIEAGWDVWRNGGPVTETYKGKARTYRAVGLQQLLDAVRESGARNAVVAGGLGYASRLDGAAEHPLSDPTGNGVIYANHFYPGWEPVAAWEARMVEASKKLPLLIGEFGSSQVQSPLDFAQRRVAQVIHVLDKHHWNWVAWCMHPSAEPCLIQDWSYTPTAHFGALVKDYLAGKLPTIPAPLKEAPNHVIYDEKLLEGWSSWSSADVELNNAQPVKEGSHSIRVVLRQGQAFQIGNVPFDAHPYQALSFWVHGGDTGGQKLKVTAKIMDATAGSLNLPPLERGKWSKVEVPLAALGVAGKENVKSFSIEGLGGDQLPFYLDDIVLVGKHKG